VPALLLAAAAALPAPASAGDECMYFRWDAGARRWVLVRLYSDEDVFEPSGERWDCKYCTPVKPPPTPDLTDNPHVSRLLDPVHDGITAVGGLTGDVDVQPDAATPLDGPDCPDVPPVWDAQVSWLDHIIP
jgi:hypothetical protein